MHPLTPVKLLACLLSIATALTLVRMSDLVAESSPWIAPADASGQTVLVHRFYAAFNATVGTSLPPDLDGVLGEDVVAHLEPAGSAPTRAGVVERLMALRATFPAMQLQPLDIRPQGDTIVVQVRVESAAVGGFLGIPLEADLVPWGTVDVFRIAAGTIAEIWSGQGDVPFLAPVADVTIEVPGSVFKMVTVERLSFEPGTRVRVGIGLGPETLVVETGHISVEDAGEGEGAALRSQASLAAGGGGQGAVVVKDGAVLALGEVLLVPQGVHAMLQNTGAVTSVMLRISVRPSGRAEDVLTNTSSEARTVPIEPVLGMTRTDLAPRPLFELPGGPAQVGVGDAILAPGARWSVVADGYALIVVESGRLVIESSDGTAWSRSGADGSISTSASGLLSGGDAVMLVAGARGDVHNAGDTPLKLQVVTITPVSAPEG